MPRCRFLPCGAFTIIAGFSNCGGDSHSPDTDASTTSVGATSDDPASTAAGSDAPESSGTETGNDEFLCASGSADEWCFERIELSVGGRFADLDGNARTDIIRGQFPDGLVEGFTNSGDEASWFLQAWKLESGYESLIYAITQPEGVTSGSLLLMSGNALDGRLSIYGLAGTTEPAPADEFEEPRDWVVGRILPAQVNGDDLVDLVLLPEGHSTMQVWLGDATDRFIPQAEIELDDEVYSNGNGDNSADAADIDGDGALDLVLSDTSLDGPLVYFGDGQGGFSEFARVGNPAVLRNIYARDIDGDSRADVMFKTGSGFVVAISEGRSFKQLVYQLGVEPFFATGEGFSFVPLDLDQDGSLELFGYHDDITEDGPVATFETSLHVMSGASEDGFNIQSSVVLDEDCSVHASEGFLPRGPIELDGDGHPDVLVAWQGSCPEDFDRVLGLMYRPP